MFTTSSLFKEAACTFGMPVACSPEELTDSEGRKGNTVTEQMSRELVNVTKKHEIIILCVIKLLQILGKE